MLSEVEMTKLSGISTLNSNSLNVCFTMSFYMYFDVAMPLTLFAVTLLSVFLNNKAERKLKSTLEEKEFQIKDTVLLVLAMGAAISLMVLIPQMAIMIIFLFSYSMLLFIFTYVFSDFRKTLAETFCLAFIIVSFALILLSFGLSMNSVMSVSAFSALLAFTFIALLYEEVRSSRGERWYLAVLPPALFVFLYIFLGRTPIWFPYLLDLYGVVFAVMITIYLGSLFTWRTSLIFVALLTVLDIILVLFTGTMVSAARHVSSLMLPVLISVPTVPRIMTQWGVLFMSLGLGDFFFAGLIAIQSFKRFGKNFAVLSIFAMSISFFIFETLILNLGFRAFPGTLMIICGWLPLVFLKKYIR